MLRHFVLFDACHLICITSHGFSFPFSIPTYYCVLQPTDINTCMLQANTSGSSAQKWKVDKIKSLLVRAKGCESKFIIRGLQGKLRIGVSESTVLTSLAHAIVLTKPKDVVELSDERLAEIRKLDGTDGKL